MSALSTLVLSTFTVIYTGSAATPGLNIPYNFVHRAPRNSSIPHGEHYRIVPTALLLVSIDSRIGRIRQPRRPQFTHKDQTRHNREARQILVQNLKLTRFNRSSSPRTKQIDKSLTYLATYQRHFVSNTVLLTNSNLI